MGGLVSIFLWAGNAVVLFAKAELIKMVAQDQVKNIKNFFLDG